MKIDNFELLGKVLFSDEINLGENEFYFLQVLVRGKDGNNVSGNNKNRLVKFYRITSREKLLQFKDEIVALCKTANARAYIHPTPRNYKNVANLFIEDAVKTFVSQNYAGMISMYSTACGKSYVTSKKLFIVDMDNIDPDSDKANDVKDFIVECGGSVKFVVPTKSGFHYVCSKFNTKKFKDRFNDIDIHKNNPTLLYFETKN